MDALHSKGNATYLDTNANCNNIGKSMPFPQPNKDVLDEIIQKRMKYNNKVRWVAEERCIRLSLEKNYTFVSKDFFEFIRTAPSFSVQEITKKESDYNMIVYALYHLKNLGILFYSEEVTS